MYGHTAIDDVDTHDLDGIDPTLIPVGMALETSEMRPSVWAYDAGESNDVHSHEAQEELYVPLSGRFELRIEDELVELGEGELIVVEPETRRQVRALEAGHILVVGAPPVKDDHMVDEP